jgi:hypothetical protein
MKKLRNIVGVLAIVGLISSQINTVKAAADEADSLLQYAIKSQNYYSYNIAYASIMKIDDVSKRMGMLEKLSTISADIYTSEIVKLTDKLIQLSKSASGRLYDEIYLDILNSPTLAQVDKDYLYTELTSWGRDKVWTPDYTKAVDAVMTAWNKHDQGAVAEAQAIIDKVGNKESMEYLKEQLKQIKDKYSIDHGANIDSAIQTKTLNAYISIISDSSTARNEKLAQLIQLFKEENGIAVPGDGYMYSIYGYKMLDRLTAYIKPDTYDELIKQINFAIAENEASKFVESQLQDYEKTPIIIRTGNTSENTYLNDRLIRTTEPLLGETSMEVVKSVPIVPFYIKQTVSNHTEVLNGKLILKPITDLKYVIDEKVELNIIYKGLAVALAYNIKIAPENLPDKEILNSSKSAMTEASHYLHHFANNNPLVIKANNTDKEIDITDKLFERSEPFPEGFELTLLYAGIRFGGGPDDVRPSKYMEVRNNRVYLKPGVPSSESKEGVGFILKYKYSDYNGTNTSVTTTIKP